MEIGQDMNAPSRHFKSLTQVAHGQSGRGASRLLSRWNFFLVDINLCRQKDVDLYRHCYTIKDRRISTSKYHVKHHILKQVSYLMIPMTSEGKLLNMDHTKL